MTDELPKDHIVATINIYRHNVIDDELDKGTYNYNFERIIYDNCPDRMNEFVQYLIDAELFESEFDYYFDNKEEREWEEEQKLGIEHINKNDHAEREHERL